MRYSQNELDIIIPIALDLDWPTADSIIGDIIELNTKYGFTHFALAGPGAGWRSLGYPNKEHFDEMAKLYLEVRDAVKKHGIDCGWWVTTTVKSGRNDKFGPVVRGDGSENQFANCPLGEPFRKRLAEDIAEFAKKTKPDFIITEDDFSVYAASFNYGCFCDKHLEEFSKREGKEYSREELVAIFDSKTPESFELLKRWRELMKDTLVGIAEAIRAEVDKENPEIPIGYMQAGCADIEGDCTEAVSRALAGPNHIPFSRLFGASYGGVDAKDIPCMTMFHSLYSIQHIKQPFHCYHESDTFPHNRYFMSGAKMRVIMGVGYSYGFIGSTFNLQQLLDNPNEETTYGTMFAKEREKFNKVYKLKKECDLHGVEVCYDPFWNTVDDSKKTENPLWTRALSLFGIPYVTTESDVAFWDERQAKYADDETVIKYLSKGLFLDGDAAKALCKRGYGKYIGVEVGEDVSTVGKRVFDLGAREVICDGFAPDSKGRNMPSAHMLSVYGNGKLLELTKIDDKCETVSEACTFQKDFISVAMTRFENELGGKVIVMGMTLDGNYSQSLYNYRRQKLIQELLCWCKDSYIFVKDAPDVYLIENKAKKPEKCGFKCMLTVINLCEDNLDTLTLHIPNDFSKVNNIHIVDENGELTQVKFECGKDNIKIITHVESLKPLFIVIS